MATTRAELESLALRLSPEDRVRLADRLLASLWSDNDVEEAWSTESQRRLAELESGAVLSVPVETAIERARKAIR